MSSGREGVPSSGSCPARAAALILIGLALTIGCGRAADRVIPFTPDPLAEARSIVRAYAGGQALGSESMGFDDLVARVTAADAAKGTKLRGFFDEVRKKGKPDAAKAKKLLGEL